jgi:ABC-type nitrate/sulfonate/bicarbonate transport system substrate-binding protein
MALKAGTIILATDASREGKAWARAWLKEQGYTPQQVRLYELDGQTLAQALVNLD